MKGFVPTPAAVVDLMVGKLFQNHAPTPDASILDPGCGTGEFIDGVIRWCRVRARPLPTIVGIESDPRHISVARARFAGIDKVTIRHSDFLVPSDERFDFIIGNPPYVPITALTPIERDTYRRRYGTARGRFDLYLLFFEQALRLLKQGGRLVFITPEKFLYVGTAGPLRALLSRACVEELHFLDEDTFGELVTYPLVSTVRSAAASGATHVIMRDRRTRTVDLATDTRSWLPAILGARERPSDCLLGDVCVRVSCGVATGADSVFVIRTSQIESDLQKFAYPTLAGRNLAPGRPPVPSHSLLVPYRSDGTLIPEEKLGRLRVYLSDPSRRRRLLARTCVVRKPWYAFHETPPMHEILRPKLLCKDIGAKPFFTVDRTGTLIPRHSVYYVVPLKPALLDELADYLNSSHAQEWLYDHCQRAANGFLRLQSHVLKRLPVPAQFAESIPVTQLQFAA